LSAPSDAWSFGVGGTIAFRHTGLAGMCAELSDLVVLPSDRSPLLPLITARHRIAPRLHCRGTAYSQIWSSLRRWPPDLGAPLSDPSGAWRPDVGGVCCGFYVDLMTLGTVVYDGSTWASSCGHEPGPLARWSRLSSSPRSPPLRPRRCVPRCSPWSMRSCPDLAWSSGRRPL
jgi:hypothetical protein